MAPSADALLRCESLGCGYPGRGVLAEVGLSLRSGAAVALIGVNGVGKSTLLKTLCGLQSATSGTVWLGSDRLSALSYGEVARRLAYVPQDEHPAFDYSALQIVLMGRLAHSSGLFETPGDLDVAHRAMSQADCAHLADRHVAELSGGERQRVLLARALAQEARVLLLDEPTAHLDVAHQVALSRTLRRLVDDGYAVLAAAHDLNWVGSFADEAVLLHSGAVATQGPVAEVLGSTLLDAAYGVAFDRDRDASGRLWLRPRPEATA